MGLRVLHVVESLRPDAGSVALCLHGMFEAVRELGIESAAVTQDPDMPAPCDVGWQSFESARAAEQVSAVDLVHIHGWGGLLERAMATAARKKGTPYLITPLGGLSEGPYHATTWKDKLRGLLGDNSIVRGARALVALNSCERRDLSERGVNKSVMSLSYGIAFSEYEDSVDASEDARTPNGVRLLLMLGPIHPVEGLVPLLKAFAELVHEADGWNILVAGREECDWRKMLEAAVRRKGGSGRVTFKPAPDPASQRSLLAGADLLAAPALHVRCPVSIMQAMACGVAVIASDRVAPDGLDGALTLCRPGKQQIAEALRRCLTLSEAQRSANAAEARGLGRTLFDWPALAPQYARLYREHT